MAHFLFPSPKSVRETFATVVRVDDLTSWRDIVFELVAYVAMGEAEPEAAAKLIGGALPKLEETAGAAEAVVDAVWSHDVSTTICASCLKPRTLTHNTTGTAWCDQDRVCAAAFSSTRTSTRVRRCSAVSNF